MSEQTLDRGLISSILDDAVKKLDSFTKFNCVGCYKRDFGYENFYPPGHDLCVRDRVYQLGFFLNQTRTVDYYLDLNVIGYNFKQYLLNIADPVYTFPQFIFEKGFIYAKLQDPTFINSLLQEFEVSIPPPFHTFFISLQTPPVCAFFFLLKIFLKFIVKP